jgi:ABC-2 type transport system ATP-binding protein
MIRCEGLVRDFNSVRAVDRIDLDVPSGSIVALLGPNGAGKTTTVRMLSGLIGITTGRAQIDDVDVNTQPALARARSGLLMGEAGLYDHMTMIDYLAFFGEAYGLGVKGARTRAVQLAEETGLADRAKDKLGKFSKGMKQRVALARALVNDPPALFLDEPTSGLDVEAAIEFRERIREFKAEQRAIILCTHVLEEAEQLADLIVVIQKGAIVARGTTADLKRSVGGKRFTIQLTTMAAAFVDHLNSVGISNAEASGDSLSFTTETPEVTNPKLIAELVRADAQIVSVTEHARSLQDAYVDIVRGSNG